MEKNEIFRKSNLERISSPEKLNDYIKVINPSVTAILVALGLLLIGGLTWGFWGNIPQSENLSGAFYASDGGEVCDYVAAVVPAASASGLKEGMEVQVSPGNADRETYGYAKGKVESVSQYPASREEVQALLKNEQLTQEVMGSGTGLLVLIAMDPDNESKSGMEWSASKGNQVEVSPGAMANAQVIIKNQKPIDLILGE